MFKFIFMYMDVLSHIDVYGEYSFMYHSREAEKFGISYMYT
jgi:hypothetical protein